MISVAVGAFADPTFPPPERSVYANRKHAWVEFGSLGELPEM